MLMTTLESCEVSKRQEQASSKRLYFNAVTQKEPQCCGDISVLCAKLRNYSAIDIVVNDGFKK